MDSKAIRDQEILTAEDLRVELSWRCKHAGGLREWARRNGVSAGHVSNVIAGKKGPGESVTGAMGLTRQVVYVRPHAPERTND